MAAVGDKNILCEHHLRTQSTLVGRFDLYFQVGWLKLLQFDFYSRKFGASAIHRRCTGAPLEKIADRCQLQLATDEFFRDHLLFVLNMTFASMSRK